MVRTITISIHADDFDDTRDGKPSEFWENAIARAFPLLAVFIAGKRANLFRCDCRASVQSKAGITFDVLTEKRDAPLTWAPCPRCGTRCDRFGSIEGSFAR